MAVTAGASMGKPPTWVFPEEPQHHNITTQAENTKKEYFNLSGTSSVDIYRLVYSGVSDSGYNGGTGLHDHYQGQSGGFTSFRWTSVPSYAIAGLTSSGVTGRWVDGSFKATPRANSWDIEINFERDKSQN